MKTKRNKIEKGDTMIYSDKKTAENFGCEYMDVDDFVKKYKS